MYSKFVYCQLYSKFVIFLNQVKTESSTDTNIQEHELFLLIAWVFVILEPF